MSSVLNSTRSVLFYPAPSLQIVKVNQSYYRPELPREFQEVKVPRLRDNGAEWW